MQSGKWRAGRMLPRMAAVQAAFFEKAQNLPALGTGPSGALLFQKSVHALFLNGLQIFQHTDVMPDSVALVQLPHQPAGELCARKAKSILVAVPSGTIFPATGGAVLLPAPVLGVAAGAIPPLRLSFLMCAAKGAVESAGRDQLRANLVTHVLHLSQWFIAYMIPHLGRQCNGSGPGRRPGLTAGRGDGRMKAMSKTVSGRNGGPFAGWGRAGKIVGPETGPGGFPAVQKGARRCGHTGTATGCLY